MGKNQKIKAPGRKEQSDPELEDTRVSITTITSKTQRPNATAVEMGTNG